MAEIVEVVKEEGDWVLHLKFPEMECFGSELAGAFEKFDNLTKKAKNPFDGLAVNEEIVNQNLEKAGHGEAPVAINDMFAEISSMIDEEDEDDSDEEVEELEAGIYEVYLPSGKDMSATLEQLLGWWIGNWEMFKEMIPDFVSQYYGEMYAGLPEDAKAENPLFPKPDKENIGKYFEIVALHLSDEEEAIGVEANCSWNDEEGLGFIIYGNGQVKIGTAEIVLNF